jgi:hypothetical protein
MRYAQLMTALASEAVSTCQSERLPEHDWIVGMAASQGRKEREGGRRREQISFPYSLGLDTGHVQAELRAGIGLQDCTIDLYGHT